MENSSFVHNKLEGLYSEFGNLFKQEADSKAVKLQSYLVKDHIHFIRAEPENCSGYFHPGNGDRKQMPALDKTSYLLFIKIGMVAIIVCLLLVVVYGIFCKNRETNDQASEVEIGDESSREKNQEEEKDRIESPTRYRRELDEFIVKLSEDKRDKSQVIEDIKKNLGKYFKAKIDPEDLSRKRRKGIDPPLLDRSDKFAISMLSEGIYYYCVELPKQNKNK